MYKIFKRGRLYNNNIYVLLIHMCNESKYIIFITNNKKKTVYTYVCGECKT